MLWAAFGWPIFLSIIVPFICQQQLKPLLVHLRSSKWYVEKVSEVSVCGRHVCLAKLKLTNRRKELELQAAEHWQNRGVSRSCEAH